MPAGLLCHPTLLLTFVLWFYYCRVLPRLPLLFLQIPVRASFILLFHSLFAIVYPSGYLCYSISLSPVCSARFQGFRF